MSAHGPPCPTCERPLTKRHLAHQEWLKRRAKLGPNRRAALDESKDGFCFWCDMPITLRKDGRRMDRYTCGKKACRREWNKLCVYDWRAKQKAKETAA